MKLLSRFIRPVYAHCDVPCGIYETDTMTHAAETCSKMIEKIEGLGEIDSPEKHNNFIRMVTTTARYAQLCKDQLYLLWSDYFKPEHLEKFPNLHEKFWLAAKQCGKVKQTVDSNETAKLQELVADIATMFADSKK